MPLTYISLLAFHQSCKALLEVILSRSSDKIASVRARALTSIAALLQQATDNAFLKAHILFIPPRPLSILLFSLMNHTALPVDYLAGELRWETRLSGLARSKG